MAIAEGRLRKESGDHTVSSFGKYEPDGNKAHRPPPISIFPNISGVRENDEPESPTSSQRRVPPRIRFANLVAIKLATTAGPTISSSRAEGKNKESYLSIKKAIEEIRKKHDSVKKSVGRKDFDERQAALNQDVQKMFRLLVDFFTTL